MTFKRFAWKWRDDVLSLKAPATIVTMRGHIFRWINPAFGHLEVGKITNSAVQNWITDLAKGRDLAPKTVSNIYGTFHMIILAAYRDGLIDRMPHPSLPRQRRRARPWFTLAQLQSLIRAAGQQKPLVWLLSETGLRIGEVIGLVPDALDRANLTLSVHQSVWDGKVQETKTDASDRVLSISPQLAELLAATIEPKKPFLFAGRIHCGRRRAGHPRHMAERLMLIHAAAGVPWQGFHCYRHSARSLWSELEIPDAISEFRMGHSPRGIEGLYRHVATGADRKWIQRISDALEGKNEAPSNQ